MIEKMKVEDVMTPPLVELNADDSAQVVKLIMDEFQTCHAPVTSGGRMMGMVCRSDANDAVTFRGPGFLSAQDFVRPCEFWVSPETPLLDMMFAMYKNRYDCVPVVNDNDELLGLIHAHDVLAAAHVDCIPNAA